ncbi:O-antigen ligase family protein [Thermospira aquatica]|uniref:O-antigen ligase family protein n=1 Tax=Thermospira aquatica TaxID=2828656 RepID=A0AAX3BG65_9SPIR|nr:O-antigen ligase family protein [Thermospira aquatica]URA11123.1 O-antigen ligase family protein [Thermospira aquatica]
MKKYLVLFGEFLFVGLVLWSWISNQWFFLMSRQVDIEKPLPAGDYVAISLAPGGQTLTIEGSGTTSIRLQNNQPAAFSLSEDGVIREKAYLRVFEKRGIWFHSLMIGVVAFLGVLLAYWIKQTRGMPFMFRFLVFAFAFGWSGSLAVFFLFVAVLSGLKNAVSHYRQRWYHWLVVGFFLWGVFSGMFARFPMDAVGSTFLFALYVFVGFVFGQENPEKLPWNAIGRAIVSAFVSVALIGLTQQFYLKQDIGVWIGGSPLLFWPYHPFEFSSLFEWAARGGYWLGLMVPVLFALFLHEKQKKLKLLFGFGIVLGLVLLVFTQSRGGFVVATVAILTQVFFLKRWYLVLPVLLLPILLLPLLVVTVAPNSKWAAVARNPFTFHTNVQRMHQMRAAKDFYREASPLTGIGLMNFRRYYYEKRHDYDIYSMADYLHQGYMAILLETGIVGFVLFYGFLFFVWVRLFRASVSRRFFLSPFIFGVMNALWVSFFFDAMLLYAFYLGMWVWMWIGLGEGWHSEKEKLPQSSSLKE